MADIAGSLIAGMEVVPGANGFVMSPGEAIQYYASSSVPIEILGYVPAVSTIIADTDPLQFDLRSAAAFLRIIITVHYPGLNWTEVAYAQNPVGVDADTFEDTFYTSTRAVVTDPGFFRYRFVLRRTPKWIDSPNIIVYAFNNTGVEL